MSAPTAPRTLPNLVEKRIGAHECFDHAAVLRPDFQLDSSNVGACFGRTPERKLVQRERYAIAENLIGVVAVFSAAPLQGSERKHLLQSGIAGHHIASRIMGHRNAHGQDLHDGFQFGDSLLQLTVESAYLLFAFPQLLGTRQHPLFQLAIQNL